MSGRLVIAVFAVGWTVLWATLSLSVRRVVIVEFPHFDASYASSETILAMPLFKRGEKSTICEGTNCLRLPILPFFKMTELECARAVEDPMYAKVANKRLVKVPDSVDSFLDTTCKAIFARGFYRLPPTDAQNNFPIAFVRVVYKNYHLQELLLSVQYSVSNEYCFAVDAKSSREFASRMEALARCLPNVQLAPRRFAVDSAGHNTSRSVLECLRALRHRPAWRYAVVLQNDDVPLKSAHEMAQILQALNGSNDVNVGRPNAERVPLGVSWTFRALNLFKDGSKNDGRVLGISKGSTGMSLSREFVNFVLDDLDLDVLIGRFDAMEYGVDEMLFSTLHSDDQLNAPGGFTQQCISTYNNLITRYVSWEKSAVRHQCMSGVYRHGICVFGLEDLAALRRSRALFANKMLPEYDYAAIACWAAHVFRRSLRAASEPSPDLAYYANRLPVRFHSQRHRWRDNIAAFNCSA